MLNKRKRLRSTEVEEVMKTGKSARSTHLQVKFVQNGSPLRSAAVAPKSVARKAVQRNNLRRTLYRALAASNMANCKGNAVFFVRLVPKTQAGATFSEELMQLLPKLS
jgi:ribonuclease P protein component